MNAELKILIDELQSPDENISTDAGHRLVLWLEATNITNLRSRALLVGQTLIDVADQQELINILAELARPNDYQWGDLLFIIGKGNAEIGFPIMVKIIADGFSRMTADSLYQALVAVENFIEVGSKSHKDIFAALDRLLNMITTIYNEEMLNAAELTKTSLTGIFIRNIIEITDRLKRKISALS